MIKDIVSEKGFEGNLLDIRELARFHDPSKDLYTLFRICKHDIH